MEADGIVFGSPIHLYGMTAQAKAILDRTFALKFSTIPYFKVSNNNYFLDFLIYNQLLPLISNLTIIESIIYESIDLRLIKSSVRSLNQKRKFSLISFMFLIKEGFLLI